MLMQFQCDLLGVEIQRPTVLDTTALGAAYLAALGTGVFSSLDEITKAWAVDTRFQPKMDASLVKERVAAWQSAVKKA
jgi:glycerol kinase